MELKNKHFEESSVNEAKLWRSGSAGAGWDVEELVATRTCHKGTVAYYDEIGIYKNEIYNLKVSGQVSFLSVEKTASFMLYQYNNFHYDTNFRKIYK